MSSGYFCPYCRGKIDSRETGICLHCGTPLEGISRKALNKTSVVNNMEGGYVCVICDNPASGKCRECESYICRNHIWRLEYFSHVAPHHDSFTGIYCPLCGEEKAGTKEVYRGLRDGDVCIRGIWTKKESPKEKVNFSGPKKREQSFCSQCGCKIESSNVKFCSYCGAKL